MDPRHYLYHARLNSHLTLDQIGLRTALSPTVLRYLDEGRFERLPSGLYARSYVRAFAEAVGLRPQDALERLEPLLPGAPDPVPALSAKDPSPEERVSMVFKQLEGWAAQAAARVQAETKAALAAGLGLMKTEVRQAQWSLKATAGLPAELPGLAAGRTERFVGPRAALLARPELMMSRPVVERPGLRPLLSRGVTALVDAVLLVVVNSALLLLVSQSSGIRLEVLLENAGPALAGFCALPILLYFLFFGGVRGRTYGQSLCAAMGLETPTAVSRTDGRSEALDLRAIVKRAVG
jgi:hypothetical protein